MTTAETNEMKERERLADQQEEVLEAVSADAAEADAGVAANEAEIGANEDDVAVEDVQANDEMEAQLAALTQQAEESQNRLLRVQADFDNFRRRTQREKEELAQYASLKLIEQLLPVVDNFERAMLAGGDKEGKDSFYIGMEMIHRQMLQVLEAEGLRKMEAVGAPFDPVMHQAVMREESEEHEEGIVLEVMQNGYWLKDKVLRPAMVKVSG